MSKYTTGELIEALELQLKEQYDCIISNAEIDAIIAKLRAADKLCEILKEEAEFRGLPELDKVIAEYEGGG